MINIEQRIIGSSSLREVCNRLAPESVIEDQGNMTGFLVAYGAVHKASKLKHTRPGGSTRFVLEVIERAPGGQERYVILTLDRDFTGREALEAYKQAKALNQ